MKLKERKAQQAYLEAAKKSPALALGLALMQGMTPKKPKRKPLLLDEVLANKHKGIPKDARKSIQAVQARLANAKVFKFDEDAAIYAAQMMRDHPEAIARDVEFAIPPFAQMYIEFPFPKFYDILTPPEMRNHPDALPLEDQDVDVGYFYDGPRVYVMSRTMDTSNANSHGMLLPLRFRLNQPFSFKEEQELAKFLAVSRLSIDTFYWGSCYQKLVRDGNIEAAKALRERHSCEVWYGDTEFLPVFTMAHLLRTNAGDMRSMIAFLLFLNRTRDLQIVDDIPPAPGWVRAKPRTLTRYNLIRIKLDPGPMLKRVFKSRATGGWRREHDVRGHWCHDRNYHANKAPHQHDLREVHHQYWKCLKCGGCKWWRKEHHRGSAKAGQVKTVYEVEK